jgi:hypothetical protein
MIQCPVGRDDTCGPSEWKNFLSFVGTSNDDSCVHHSTPWRRRLGASAPPRRLCWVLSPSKSQDLAWSAMMASSMSLLCWEHCFLGHGLVDHIAFVFPCSGVCRFSRLNLRGEIHTFVTVSKAMSFLGPTKSPRPLFESFRHSRLDCASTREFD